MPEPKAYLLANDQRTPLTYEETTIGRLSSNLIPINDPTISKNHAVINYISSEDCFYLRDLNTVNGTYLNGTRLEPNKRQLLKHKDSIQFGKHSTLFGFFMSQPQSEKKGKINLKDYCFQLDSDGEEPKKESIMRPPTSLGKSNGLNNKSSSNVGREGKKLKIPNLADYLQLSGSLLSEQNSNQGNQSNQDKYKSSSKFARQGKVALPKMANEFDEEDLERVRKEEEGRRNIFLARQAEKQAREQKARALQESKIRLQVQKHKHEEEMLRRQLQLESRVRDEQQRMESEKRRIQQELLRREEERRERERALEEQQREKERRLVERLQQEKQEELRRIKSEEELLRTRNQTAMREQLEHKKRDLQMEAQALAQQYQQIYRDTIKKMKNDIEKQEAEIQELERNIQSLKEENTALESKHNQVTQAAAYAKKQFGQISGRNKAFILYASELQDRLDRLKNQKQEQGQGEKRVSAKLKEEILNSRKLLSMKKNEVRSLEEEISKLRLSLNVGGNRMGQGEMLETIIENHHAIQHCKSIYFEYLREEKALKQLWEQQLAENQQAQHRNFTLEKEVQNGKKQLYTNVRDNISRLTQQRLHMLKCLHYLPEEKKRAAKFLIEQMVTMEEEIRAMIVQSEQSHDKIQQLIVDSQRKKQENEYLSQLLFGADSTAHHFDNMKVQINTLIERLQLERDDSRVAKRIKLTQEIQNNEIAIHECMGKLERLKNRWREGLQGQKIVLAEKNPIVFFGDLLTKREADLQDLDFRISKIEREHAEILIEVQQLQRKKQSLNDTLQRFKREELQKVRESLL